MELDGVESPLPQALAEALERLETLLTHTQTSECAAAAIRVQVAALLSWGEVLQLEAFITLAQVAMTLMRLSPDQAPMIAQLALHGFRAVYQLQALILSPSQDQRAQSMPSLVLESAPALSSSPWALAAPLQTTHLFVWQMAEILWTLPAHDVIEILIPKPDQLVTLESKPGFYWNDRVLPLYHLILQQGAISPGQVESIPIAVGLGLSNPGSPVLIISQGLQTLALGVEIDALVTEPVIPLLALEGDHPAYSYAHGYTQREGRPTLVIDVSNLLNIDLNDALQVALPALDSLTAECQNRATSGSDSPTMQQSPPTIMVVDDSQTLRTILAITLQTAGYEVVEAEDGQDALTQLQHNRAIQLIVCDVEMPNMNGFEFLSYCRRDPKLAKLPVVMLSTFNNEQHHQLASAFGATAYFGKPYNEAEFLAALRSMLVVN